MTISNSISVKALCRVFCVVMGGLSEVFRSQNHFVCNVLGISLLMNSVF